VVDLFLPVALESEALRTGCNKKDRNTVFIDWRRRVICGGCYSVCLCTSLAILHSKVDSTLKIAVVGCGIAGCCSAILLKRQEHCVHLFEQAPELRPVGAGVMLQPLGQRVLERMGLLDQVVANAEPIRELHAIHRSGKTMIKMPFSAAKVGMHAYGVHRGDIFEVLVKAVIGSQIPIELNATVHQTTVSNNQVSIECADGRRFVGFDRVIISSGSKCSLRSKSGFRKREKEYDYAAIWCNLEATQVRNQLLQIVDGSTRLMGILPMGNGRASLFWGLACRDRERCMQQTIEQWKEELRRFYPPATETIDSIQDWSCATYGTYRRASVAPVYDDYHIFLGDAAHANSPHLGQGLNFAMLDAYRFAKALEELGDWQQAGKRFLQEQRDHSRYYRFVTALLTPFFQSDGRWRGRFRDCTLPFLCRTPIIRGQMALTMTGLKSGFLGGAIKWN
jgi:2-polyprenyl-6-methoxyphenol hydroxylase-like FAD-dependent oxidoreductase